MQPTKKLRLLFSNRSDFLNRNPGYSKYSIGDFSYGEPVVLHWGEKATLRIGRFCSIATGVTILLGGEHNTDFTSTYPFKVFLDGFEDSPKYAGTNGDVTIGNDVWIGTNALILSGVKIRDGAVIGASSVVTKDIEPYSVVAGNPARMIRKRFDEETIERLLRIKWWNWEIQRIRESIPLLTSNRVKEFVEKNDPLPDAANGCV